MSVKKNLTVATVMALLAVPAFSVTNVNATSQLNTPTGRLNHAYNGYPIGTTIYDGHGPGGAAGPSYMENGALGHGYDNSHPLVEIPAKYVNNFNPRANTYSDNSKDNNNSTNGSQVSEYQNGSTNNGKLVQTGENDGANKAMALGASALIASAGFMALSFARKHKYLESVDLASNVATVSASNNKGNNDDTLKYSNKSSYDMIMSNTFNDISKSLKNL